MSSLSSVGPLVCLLPVNSIVARCVDPFVCVLSPLVVCRFRAAGATACRLSCAVKSFLPFLFFVVFVPAICPPAEAGELVSIKRVVGIDASLLSKNEVAEPSVEMEMKPYASARFTGPECCGLNLAEVVSWPTLKLCLLLALEATASLCPVGGHGVEFSTHGYSLPSCNRIDLKPTTRASIRCEGNKYLFPFPDVDSRSLLKCYY